MAIVVETGAIVSGANSYVTEAELTSYAADRGVTISSGQETLLLKAMDYIEQLDYVGIKYTRDQPLQWPRDGVWIDGFEYATSEIPDALKTAELSVALAINNGFDPLAVIERATSRERLGDLEVEYQENAAAIPVIRSINAAIRKIVKGGGGLEVKRW